jgi:AcrR family transcriptional regulator
MARTKTISDDEILAVARDLFRTHGHAVTTRQVADSAGISEGVLYQRFGNKDELFFAAMAPSAPDLDEILGPEEPREAAEEYVQRVVARMAGYFGEVLPLALRLITHPSFDRSVLARVVNAQAKLQHGLVRRLTVFESRRRLRRSVAQTPAHLLISLAHDWALTNVMAQRSPAKRSPELEAMVDVVLRGAIRGG